MAAENVGNAGRSALEGFVHLPDLADLRHAIDAFILFFGDYKAERVADVIDCDPLEVEGLYGIT